MDQESIIKEILEKYPENFNQQDLEVTKGFMVKSNARKFETLDSKLDLLHFHGFTHSPQFRRMLQDSAAAAARSAGSRTRSSASS